MPTGYTADVQSGKITEFKDFAMYCARAFGALIEMRDDPADAKIPDEIKPSDYYAKALAAAEDELAALNAMTDDEVIAAAAKGNADAIAYFQKYLTERGEQRSRYELMLKHAVAWMPPTDEHVGLRDFMIEQLRSSIDFDCRYVPEAPKQITATEWLNSKREDLTSSIARYRDEDAKERKRAADRTAWVKALRASLT